MAERRHTTATKLRELADEHDHTRFTLQETPAGAPPDERDRIRAAMDRILAGAPERSNGALTIVALAIAAGIPRNALAQRHPDLRNEFYEHVKARGGTPDVETRFRKKIVGLKTTISNTNDEFAQLKVDVQGFLAENTRLTLENQELRDVLVGNTTNVVPLRLAPHR
ncbi:hypothetical protein [Kitasatospora sp. NPDC002965]|uniref:hypothetical protein n=1 Tax=Kitasatospora sp. NPDC002965 TaxID=3154775 RepID=UPI0033B357D5